MNRGTEGAEPKIDKEYSSEELYRILFEQATDGIFIIDAQTGSIEVNRRGCEMLGYTQAEIRKKSIPDLFPDENMQAVFTNQSAIEAGHSNIHEGRLPRKDGSFLSVEVNGQKLKDGRSIGIVRDISEREQAKEEMLQLARFPAENPNPVLRVSAQGKIMYANEASRALLSEWGTQVGGMLPSAWKKTTNRLAGKGSSQSVEVPCKGRIYSMTITPVRGADYVNLYGSDITEIRRSEEALRRAEEKFRNIFENSQDGIFQSTPAGRFITVNPALARIWGYDSPEEIIESVTNIAHQIYVKPEEREEFLRLMDELGEVEDFEFRAHRKDGSVIWVQENVRTVRDADGNVQYYEGTVKDITGQKQTLEALRRSEERYRNTLNNMMEGCQIIDFDWRYIYVNDTAALHGRRKPEEMLMRTMMELYPGIEVTELFAALRDCMERRTSQRLENQFTFPDGNTGWFELSVQPVPEGLFILSIDISERKQAETELKDREARYRTLFENLPIPVFTKDREGRYTSFNAEESKYWETSPIGRSDHELLPPEVADALRTVDLRVMETEEPWFGEEIFQSPFGLQYSLSRKVPLYDGAGNVIGVLGASVDITERKEAERKRLEAEQALRDSEARFSKVFHASPVSIALTRLKDNVLIDVNEAWLELTGLSGDEAVGHTPMELNVWVAPAERTELIEALQKHGRVEGFEFQARKKSGEVADTLLAAELIELAGEVHMLSMAVDISDRKRAERALLESEERYRDLVDNSQELICTHDLEGNILSVNPWASKTLGYRHKDILNKNIADFLLPENRPAFHKYLVDIQNKGRVQGQMTVRTRSGEQLIWEYNNSLRTEGVEQPIVRGIAHDVTEQRKAETKIKKQLARLTALRKIDQSITSSFDLNQTLDMLVKEVTLQLEVDAAAILLVDFGANILEFAVGNGFYGDSIRELRLKVGEDYAGKIVLDQKMVKLSNLAIAEPPFGKAHLTDDENFVAYFGLPLIAKGQIKGVLEVFHRSPLDPDEDWLAYLETLAGQAAIAIDNAQLFKNLQETNSELTQAYDATIEGWSYALDLRDKETEGHTLRVTEITTGLCKKFGFNEDELRYARWGALLHDIGKMGVPDAILQKPDKLSDDEWVIMKMHPLYARKMLERINYLKSAIDIPHCHHEKWDGSGYPRNLQGEQIPLQARIFAIADVWDALTSNRPYRPAWPKKDALEYIKSGAGTHFDPQVVEMFLASEELWKDVDG